MHKISYYYLLLFVFVHLGCVDKEKKITIEKNTRSQKITKDSNENEVKRNVLSEKVKIKALKTKLLTQEGAERLLDSLKTAYEPIKVTQSEFKNFKMKSNYKQVINDYKDELFRTYFDYLNSEEKFRFYSVPTEVNKKQYGSNSFVFGDLNNDGRKDCIVTSLSSDMYNEIHFFYVFINDGKRFKLMDVVSEEDLAGCKNGGWPSSFRYQKIEAGFFKGISFCHYKDAHCCPSLVFKSNAKYIDDQLQFHSAEFVFDEPYIMKYRPTPSLDSVLVKSNIN